MLAFTTIIILAQRVSTLAVLTLTTKYSRAICSSSPNPLMSTCRDNPSDRCRDHKWQPHRGKVRWSLKSVGFILWAPWKSVFYHMWTAHRGSTLEKETKVTHVTLNCPLGTFFYLQKVLLFLGLSSAHTELSLLTYNIICCTYQQHAKNKPKSSSVYLSILLLLGCSEGRRSRLCMVCKWWRGQEVQWCLEGGFSRPIDKSGEVPEGVFTLPSM